MRRLLVCWLTFLIAVILSLPAMADKRVALVVGNGQYSHVTPLDNPTNDARLLAEALRSVDFTVIGGGAQLNLDKQSFEKAVQEFGAKLQGANVALFYYAGHGLQMRGINYLVPVDANPTREADVGIQMLDANLVLNQMEGSGTKLNIVILDACRNDPFSGRGLAMGRSRDIVGIQRYSDGYIQRLERAANDAKDLAKDLEEVGFDKKNIKLAVDLSSRDAFEKEFSAFLNTIEAGDDVVFYFSGHGFGVEADQTNYLLFAGLKSPFTYTKSQLSDQERKNPDVVRLKISQYLDAYQKDEIPNGVSANEIERRIGEKNPKTVIMILDACRSLVQNDVSESQDAKLVKRGDDSGSRLLKVRKPRPGFLILYSASFGEQAAETLGKDDFGQNSLFTGVLRSELQRPGQSAVQLGERVKLMVRAIANGRGRQQEPEVFYDEDQSASVDDFYFVGSIGRERFQMSEDRCAGDEADWKQIKDLQKRELYDRHIRRFDLCPHGTAQLARRALATLALNSDDPIEGGWSRQVGQ
jgi:uncharacterized protein (UPF0335 family)